tara:strand:- start:536 stop:718 length:183 start_codon:yes stop_codon:yes gene_type:complete
MNITIDEIAQAETGLVEIEKEIREARFHDDVEHENYMLKEKLETLKFLASAEKQQTIRRN